MLPKSWRPRNSIGLNRVGPNYDGGYVIPEILFKKTKMLFGLGVSDNWDFEKEFQERCGCDVVCYDHTVNAKFWRRRFKKDLLDFLLLKKLTPSKIANMFKYLQYKKFFDGKTATHHKIMIGYDLPGSISIDGIMKAYQVNDVFFKIDIEGGEYRVMDQIKNHSDAILGFAIELHDADVHKERITKFIADLTRYRLVHIHANNNHVQVDTNGDPLHVEMTFLRDDLIESDAVEDRSYPIEGLDYPNTPKHKDIHLSFEQ